MPETSSTRQSNHPKFSAAEARVLMPAIYAAMIMTALADGSVGQNEKDALVEMFYIDQRRNMSPQDVLTLLQQLINAIALNKEQWSRLFEEAKGLRGELKIEILRACAKMAHMDDGTMWPEEKERLDSIASWIEIDPQDKEVWDAEYRRVQEGEIA